MALRGKDSSLEKGALASDRKMKAEGRADLVWLAQAPTPLPSPSTLSLQTSRAIVKAPEGWTGPASPEGILGISPFSTSYGNALEGTGNWPPALWVPAPPWRLRRVRGQ